MECVSAVLPFQTFPVEGNFQECAKALISYVLLEASALSGCAATRSSGITLPDQQAQVSPA
jgi:hypothetical protein